MRERKEEELLVYLAAHVSLKSAMASMSCPPSATSCSADLGGGDCSGAPGAAGVTSGDGAAGSASVSVAMDAPRFIIRDSCRPVLAGWDAGSDSDEAAADIVRTRRERQVESAQMRISGTTVRSSDLSVQSIERPPAPIAVLAFPRRSLSHVLTAASIARWILSAAESCSVGYPATRRARICMPCSSSLARPSFACRVARAPLRGMHRRSSRSADAEGRGNSSTAGTQQRRVRGNTAGGGKRTREHTDHLDSIESRFTAKQHPRTRF